MAQQYNTDTIKHISAHENNPDNPYLRLLDQLIVYLPPELDPDFPIAPKDYFPPDVLGNIWHIRKPPPEDALDPPDPSLDIYPVIPTYYTGHQVKKLDIAALLDETKYWIHDPISDQWFPWEPNRPHYIPSPFPSNGTLQIFYDVKRPNCNGYLPPRSPKDAWRIALLIAGCPELCDPLRLKRKYLRHKNFLELPPEVSEIVHEYAMTTYNDPTNRLNPEIFRLYFGRILMDLHHVNPNARIGTRRFQHYQDVWERFVAILNDGDKQIADFIPLIMIALLGYESTDAILDTTAGWDDQYKTLTLNGEPCLKYLFDNRYTRFPNLNACRMTQLRKASLNFVFDVLNNDINLPEELEKMVIYIANLVLEYCDVQYLVSTLRPDFAFEYIKQLPDNHQYLYSSRIRNYYSNQKYWKLLLENLHPDGAIFFDRTRTKIRELLESH